MRKPRIGSEDRAAAPGLARPVVYALLLTAAFVLCAGVQKGPPSASPVPAAQLPPGVQFPEGDPAQEQKRLRAINLDRQKSMAADTEKLLKLARALNDEVEKTHPDALTPSQLRTLAEIEKLAHRVKDKMSYSFMGAPVLREPPRVPGGVR
jgi:hypothetical protein